MRTVESRCPTGATSASSSGGETTFFPRFRTRGRVANTASTAVATSRYMGWASMPDDVLARALATVAPASAKHLALVEAARNRYRMAAAAADRADKEKASRPGS
jgi:hypothetical protein